MTVQTASLEDVFLELTEDGGAVPAPKKAEAPAEPEPGWELEEESEEGGTD